jgi:hypothetical protein
MLHFIHFMSDEFSWLLLDNSEQITNAIEKPYYQSNKKIVLRKIENFRAMVTQTISYCICCVANSDLNRFK